MNRKILCLILILTFCVVFSVFAMAQDMTVELEDDSEYEYTTFTINADGNALISGGWREFDDTSKPCGIVAFRKVISDGVYSEPSDKVYVSGDFDKRKQICEINKSTGFLEVEDSSKFVAEKWTASSIYSLDDYTLTAYTSGAWIKSTLIKSVRSAENEYRDLLDCGYATDEEIAEAYQTMLDERKKLVGAVKNNSFKYAFSPEEIIPLSELKGFKFVAGFNLGAAKYNGNFTSKVDVYTVDVDGNFNVTSFETEALGYDDLRSVEIVSDKEEEYVVAIEIFAWYGQNNPELFKLSSDNSYSTVPKLVFNPNDYVIEEKAVLPVLSIEFCDNGHYVQIENYDSSLNYFYSFDNGISWHSVNGDSIVIEKASVDYLVKAMNSQGEVVGEPVSVKAPDLVCVGSSLYIESRVGINVYFDIADELATKEMLAQIVTINEDYETDFSLYSDISNLPVAYHNEKDLYYVTLFLSPKDFDNVSFDVSILIDSESLLTVASINILDLIDAYVDNCDDDSLANLLTTLKDYARYSDAFFSDKPMTLYSSKETICEKALPEMNSSDLDGVEFYGSALLLEDRVTIRHYFKVEDVSSFQSLYDTDVRFGTKAEYIYFDIENVSVLDLFDQKDFYIKDKEGNVVCFIKYSVSNYIDNNKYSDNESFLNLVKSMYDYSVKAIEYSERGVCND